MSKRRTLRTTLTAASLALSASLPVAASNFGCNALQLENRDNYWEGPTGYFFRVPDMRMYLPFPDLAVELIGDLSDALASRGTTLVFAPVPAKSQVHWRDLPDSAAAVGFDPRMSADLYRDVIARLQGEGVVTVDLLAALENFDPQKPPFHQADFHWTPEGAQLASRAVGAAISGIDGLPPAADYETVQTGETAHNPPLRRKIQAFCAHAIPAVVISEWETRMLSGAAAAVDLGMGQGAAQDGASGLGLGIADAGNGGTVDLGLDNAAPAQTATIDLGLGSQNSASVDLGVSASAAPATGSIDLGLGSSADAGGSGATAGVDLGLSGGTVDLGLGSKQASGVDLGISTGGSGLGLGLDAGTAMLEAPRNAGAGPVIVLAGTSYSVDSQAHFAGFITQETGHDVLNVSILGGNQFGSIVSYITSDEFAEAPPHVLIWETPIYSSLTNFGEAPLSELVAAAHGRCIQELPTVANGNTLTADLTGIDINPATVLRAEAGRVGFANATFRFKTVDGFVREVLPRREERWRATGRLHFPMAGFGDEQFASVNVEFTRNLPPNARLSLCEI